MSESDTKVKEPGEEGAEEEEEEGEDKRKGGGIVIQGGVGKKVRAQLAENLKEVNYSKESSQHRVYLFCNWNKEWDATVFGVPKTVNTKDLFLSTNIVPILLHDPGKGELAWGEDGGDVLRRGGSCQGRSGRWQDRDRRVRRGQNRSVAMGRRSLAPSPASRAATPWTRRPGYPQQGKDRRSSRSPPQAQARGRTVVADKN